MPVLVHTHIRPRTVRNVLVFLCIISLGLNALLLWQIQSPAGRSAPSEPHAEPSKPSLSAHHGLDNDAPLHAALLQLLEVCGARAHAHMQSASIGLSSVPGRR